MAKFTVIAKISEAILSGLKDKMVPELIRSDGQIALCSPGDRENAMLGIFLYDVQESELVRTHAMVTLSEDRQQYPPVFLELYYMVTPYCDGDIRFRYIQEAQLLGKVIQHFHDIPFLLPQEVNARIELQRLSTEDKLKLWNFSEQSFKVSLFYKVSPVPVDSAVVRSVNRVKEVSIHAAGRNQT